MGRRTYDQALRMGPFPYLDKDCYVFSRSLMGGDDDIEFVNQPVKDFVQALRERDGSDIWLVGGSELIGPFMKERLIDCLLYTSPSPRDGLLSRMPSSA